MEPARAVLAVIGLVFAVLGIYLAAAFEPLLGMAFLIVGAFLLILPFATLRSDE